MGKKFTMCILCLTKLESFNSGESEEDFPEKEAPLKDSTNEPEKTEPAASKNKKENICQ